jgi:hypothetical protein
MKRNTSNPGRIAASVVAFGIMAAAAGWMSQPAQARTITVNTSGGPQTRRCNLTDAIRAANTNRAVHGCPAGDAAFYDLIQLQANTTYQNYGEALVLTSPIIIRGVQDPTYGSLTSIIMGHNYGVPTLPSTTTCGASAVYAGPGDSYLQTVLLINDNPSGATFSGVCNYGGNLAVEDSAIGQYGNGFTNGAIVQDPNTNLTVRNSSIQDNSSATSCGGISSSGNAQLYVMDSFFYENSSSGNGGGIALNGDDGYLDVSDSQFYYNFTEGQGGAIYLNPATYWTATITARISGTTLSQNSARWGGGGIWLGPINLELDATTFSYNVGDANVTPAIRSLNTDTWVRDAITCNQGSSVDYLNDLPWSSHTPRLYGDGTCVFP